jgi:hypothetical protein
MEEEGEGFENLRVSRFESLSAPPVETNVTRPVTDKRSTSSGPFCRLRLRGQGYSLVREACA